MDESRKQCLFICEKDQLHDLYIDNYHPQSLSIVSDLFTFKEVSHSVRDYMPNCETDFSPFVIRAREGKRREESKANNVKSSFAALIAWSKGRSFQGGKANNLSDDAKNPSVAGTSSTASNTSQPSESDEDEDLSTSDDFDHLVEIAEETKADPDVNVCKNLTFGKLFKDAKACYGIDFKEPSAEDHVLYERWVKFDQVDKPRGKFKNFKSIDEARTEGLFRPFDYVPHDYRKCLLPMPSEEDQAIYKKYIDVGRTAKSMPSKKDLKMYMDYVSFGRKPSKEDLANYQKYLKMIDEEEALKRNG